MNGSLIGVLAFLVVGVSSTALPAWRTTTGCVDLWNTKEDKEWCDPVLGCLYITGDWYHPNRPINVCPDSREHINTRFMLHTRNEPGETTDTFLTADKAVIDASTFDPAKPIKFITHGFIDTGNTEWLKRVARALITQGDYNVIRVNWGAGSLPMYYSATANTRVVGLEIAYLVNFFIDNYGVDPANVHLIGHSLGSHVSGYAGERISGLGRITGLDPAGPYFTETPSFIHLDATDAVFVDNIHTDADTIFVLGYGTEQEMGNVDFYPNSGHDQPGCDPVSIGIEIIDDIGEGGRDLAACSHDRSVELFEDSLGEPCPYLAHECIDYDSFEQGRCASCNEDNSACAFMGIHADQYTAKTRENVRMYFDTDSKAPYCYYHYQLVIDTAHPRNAEDWVQGHLNLWLYGDNGNVIEKVQITKEHERFDHGQPKYFLLTSHVDISRVIRVEAHWKYDDTLTNPGSYCFMLLCNRALYVRSVRISSMEYYPEESRLDHTRVVCDAGSDYLEIKSGHTAVMTSDDSCVFTIS
ncbi:pancreatic triacylglycerol lipase-like [Penaeus monodon]|uniref:pancreatic triacylglycerol lipase-like n=1 Tax=Penaeus monodon TaxID=6687 RepID=UPI0018A74CD0|nr:pancreatic triacylglycerol lipase-like [Penaeus monodon]